MPASHPNPWLRQAITELREQTSDEKLRTRYDLTRQKDSGLSWEDFLWDLALQRQLDQNPVLKTRTDDMPLSPHAKDILKANYIDALVMLVQMTADELCKVPGFTGEELDEINSYLGSLGITLEEGEVDTVKQAWEECFEEKKNCLRILDAFKERRKVVREDPSLNLNEMVGKEVELYEETDVLLMTRNADKGTRQRFLWEYACFLHENMSTCPEETADALKVARRELALKEYLYGPEHRLTGQSLELVGMVCQEIMEYTEAVPYYRRAVSILERELGEGHHDVADMYQPLGLCLLESKEHDQALEAFMKAYDGYMNQRGRPDMMSLGHLCYLIADTYREKGDMKNFSEFVTRGKLFLD